MRKNIKPKIFFAVRKQWYDKVFSDRDLDRVRSIAAIIEAPIPEMPDKPFMLDHIAAADIVVTSWDTPQLDQEIMNRAAKLELVVHAGRHLRGRQRGGLERRKTAPLRGETRTVGDNRVNSMVPSSGR